MTSESDDFARSNVALVRAKEWQGPWYVLPPHLKTHPTLLVAEELRMLRWLASGYYSGEGCICDLGAYLGGSTMALADGYLAAGHQGPRIHTYDRHTINEKAFERFGLAEHHAFPEGGYFLELFKSLLKDQLPALTIHSGEFLEQPVPDESIEILFIDIAKTVATHDHILKNFFPRLIPGKSVIIQQDYFFPWPPWDAGVMEILHDYFETLAQAGPHSAIFLNTKAIPEAVIDGALASSISNARMRSLILTAAGRWPYQQQRVALFRAHQLLALHADKALGEISEYPARAAFGATELSRDEFRRLVDAPRR